MSKVEAFLSHKAKDGILARQIREALGVVLPSNAAEEEDKLGTGIYLRTEGLLLDLKRLNDQYLKLALPRLNRLLGSTNDSMRNPRTRLEDRRSENWRCDRPNS